jgi:hypothetical protein
LQVAAMQTVFRIFEGNREILSLVKEDIVALYCTHMIHREGHLNTAMVRIAKFLGMLCSCDNQPIVKNQEMVCKVLFHPNFSFAIPRFIVTYVDGQARLSVQLWSKKEDVLASVEVMSPAPKIDERKLAAAVACDL